MGTYCINTLDRKTADIVAFLFPGKRTCVEKKEPEKRPSIYDLVQDNSCVYRVCFDTELGQDEVERRLKHILCYQPSTDRLYGKSADRLEAFLNEDRSDIVSELEDLQSSIEDCFVSEAGNIGIDVRLCVDYSDNGQYTWNIKSGNVQFDQEHSDICIADFISRDSNLEELAETLIGSAIDEAAMRE